MLTGDLGSELTTALRQLAAGGALPAAATTLLPAGTWRPAPNNDPASFATSLPFRIARLDGRDAADVAAALARPLRALSWVRAARPAASGYLTITVTQSALAAVAGRIAAAGPSCAQSTVLRGTAAVITPWPDLAAARSWPLAWRAQANAMTGRLSHMAGADLASAGERGPRPDPAQAGSPVTAAVAWFGDAAVRYSVSRALPRSAGRLAWQLRPGHRMPGELTAVQVAHADAASTQRWAADLRIELAGYADPVDAALSSLAERQLLGLLSWLPEKVASAARRSRPDELPRYLEHVAAAWMTCQHESPALPFGGQAGAVEPGIAGARLLLAEAARIVLAAGLKLTGIAPADRL
ncbi:MAG: DALR anticodon-binding domain-containing protein [Streptosporangiaceae bacterium]